jgi:hypothetical protein
VTFESSYKYDGGNWKSMDSFNGSELLLLANLAGQAHTEVENFARTTRRKPTSPPFIRAGHRRAW